jgi:hypothetical protein
MKKIYIEWLLFGQKLLLSLLLLLFAKSGYCQSPKFDTVSIFNMPIVLDTFVKKSGFDIGRFIRRVQTDTTFYQAFRNMRFVNYQAQNNITVFGEGRSIKASLRSITQQQVKGRCRQTKIISQTITGNLFKKSGSYNYYTVALYDHLFFAREPICQPENLPTGIGEASGDTRIEKSEFQLKQLIFNPGGRVKGIPFMGDRASIFSEAEKEKYTFTVTLDTFLQTECFVFTVLPKPNMTEHVLYNNLTTWFRTSDFAIIARNWSLSYSTLLYDFNVAMKVKLTAVNDKLYPYCIEYAGDWHIFTQKREQAAFKMDINYSATNAEK